MSRIGQVPLQIPPHVECNITGQYVVVKGGKGTSKISFSKDFSIEIHSQTLKILAKETAPLSKEISMLYGTLCRNIRNMIIGVSEGFEKKLELVGVGYKADLQGGKVLKLVLGYSHDILYPIPEGITISIEKLTFLKIMGIDKQKVGQTTSEIIKFRPPEPYKGKGIRIPGQYIRRKEGKTKK